MEKSVLPRNMIQLQSVVLHSHVKQKSFSIALVLACSLITLSYAALRPASRADADASTQAFILAYIPQQTVSLLETDTTNNTSKCYTQALLGANSGNWVYLGLLRLNAGDTLTIATFQQDNCAGTPQSIPFRTATIPATLTPSATCWLNLDRNTISGCNGGGAAPDPHGIASMFSHIPQQTVSLLETDTTNNTSKCYTQALLGANSGNWVYLGLLQVKAGDALTIATFQQDNCTGTPQSEPFKPTTIPATLTPSTTCWINIENNFMSGCNGVA